MSLRYRCLILDHDDTTVESTRLIHHPTFLDTLTKLRPELPKPSFEDYMAGCFEVGPVAYFRTQYHLTDEEMAFEHENWLQHAATATPPFFPGMPELIADYRAQGGIIVVASGSFDYSIRFAYDYAGVARPDRIFGCELPPELRKPATYAVDQVCADFGLSPSDCFVIDDALFGLRMAKAAGTGFAGAAWAQPGERVVNALRDFGPCFDRIDQLRAAILTAPSSALSELNS